MLSLANFRVWWVISKENSRKSLRQKNIFWHICVFLFLNQKFPSCALLLYRQTVFALTCWLVLREHPLVSLSSSERKCWSGKNNHSMSKRDWICTPLEAWDYLNVTLLYVKMENTSIDQRWLTQIKKWIQLDGILKGSEFARKQHHGPSCLLSDYQAELSQPFVLYHTSISYTMCLPGTGRCETQPVSWVLHWPL